MTGIRKVKRRMVGLYLFLAVGFVALGLGAWEGDEDLDSRVRTYLKSHDWGRGDMNVPTVDGQTLHDIIVKNGYTRALEIGTSTGHSGIWIAWALSKTGGRLVTIDIDRRRHEEALKNFE
ncbi:MAG: hypothetical protein MUP70_12685, partial [Candidatus Aminicenantes bacterium]|nr:hypothetical protein [Candidatus Aminicenantes bacterium]